MASAHLRCRVTTSGEPRWQVRYRLGGRESRLKVAGTYRSVERAEQVLEEILTAIAGGRIWEWRARPDEPEQVYFARLGELIKIGVSVEPHKRCTSLNAELLLVRAGGRKAERRLHEKFAHLRETGEWFQAGPELLAYVREEQILDRRRANWRKNLAPIGYDDEEAVA